MRDATDCGRNVLAAAVLVLAVAGCAASDGGTRDAGDGGGDVEDGAEASCPPPGEFCGGDCVDTSGDPAHCGECFRPCGSTNAFPSCVGGACVLECYPGWVDANGNPFDGCEYACTATAEREEPGTSCADGLDGDCDGRTDDADPDCAACIPEFCNGSDDDCDGLTDEDFDTDFDSANCGRCGFACPPRPHGRPDCVLGECDAVCEPGWRDANGSPADGCESRCEASPVSDESLCDGVDDDCDGVTDEDFAPAASCGAGLCRRAEMCHRGVTRCVPREPPGDDDATCDGLDDDCDGATDEDAHCGCLDDSECDEGRPCLAYDCLPDGTCTSAPVADRTPCLAGACCAGACVGPGPEPCNGVDDDCDGATDEDSDCAVGAIVACTTTCGSTGSGACSLACTLPAPEGCTPPAESCNGVDDDCDTTCDEGSECCARAVETRACTCGAQTRTCSDTCTWGPWSTCPTGTCTPGATRNCGDCGTQTCAPSCSWGTCADPGYVGCSDCGSSCRHAFVEERGSCGGCNAGTCSSCAWVGLRYDVTPGCSPGGACVYEVMPLGWSWGCHCP